MRTTRIRKQRIRTTRDTQPDLRTPSGRPLPY